MVHDVVHDRFQVSFAGLKAKSDRRVELEGLMIELDELERRLKELGAILREALVPDDPRWFALAEGKLSPHEVELLYLESPVLYECFRPLTPTERARVLTRF